MRDLHQVMLHDALLVSAARAPDEEAIVADGERHTYAELLGAARGFATALLERGVTRGDRVVIFLDNGFAAAASIYGTLLAGGVFVVLNPQTKTDKLAFVLEDSAAKVLVTHPRFARVFEPALARMPSIATMLAKELPAPDGDGPMLPETIPLDLAALIYTSGSTGNPKGVMMTHESMVFASASIASYLRLRTTDRIISVLPLAFDYGMYQLLMSVRLSATLVLERSFAFPAEIVARMKEEKITVFPGVPTIFSMLLSMHERSGLVLEDVERVSNTAAALPAPLIPKLKRLFPNALIFKMYGLTECKRVAYLEPEELDEHASSVGRAMPGTEAFVLRDDGSRAQPGEIGMLHVRGRHVMRGYWNRPDLTEEMLRTGPVPGERLLCTQDLFREDDDGYLYFVGRSDDILKVKGEKVSPVEVENALLAVDGIREAAVIGIPDEVQGQTVCAHVRLEDGADLTEKQIRTACASRLEPFMVPSRVVFAAELPKTPSGKIAKRDLA